MMDRDPVLLVVFALGVLFGVALNVLLVLIAGAL